MITHRRNLWQLLAEVKGNAAEIGVASGLFALEIIEWSIAIPRVYLIDRWAQVKLQRGDAGFPQSWHDKNLRECQQRLSKAGVADRAVLLRGDSVEMARHIPNTTLRFVYVDADHSYEGVKRDIEAWHMKLVPGGIMAFHDYESAQYGVKRAVTEFCKRNHFEVCLLPENAVQDAGAYYVNPV